MIRSCLPARLLRALFLVVLIAFATAASAQTATMATLTRQLSQAEADLAAVDHGLDGQTSRQDRQRLQARALAAKQAAAAAAGDLQTQLTLLDARIGQLGPVPEGQVEAPELRQQRASLTRQRAALDSAVKRGRLLGVTADQLVDEIAASEAEQFGQRIFTRAASPLSPAFWTAVAHAFPRDARRVTLFLALGARAVVVQAHGGVPWPALLGVVLAAALLIPGRAAIKRLGRRWLVDGTPGHRVRRSGYALWRMVAGTLVAMLAGAALVQGLHWSGPVPPRWSALLDALAGAMTLAGFIAATGGALLMPKEPSWRVAPIGDEAARRLRPLSLILAGLAFGGVLLGAFNGAVGASGAARIATQALEALLNLLLIGGALLAVGRIRAAQARTDAGESTRAGLGALALLAWVTAIIGVVALLSGYIGFSLFLVQLIGWGAVLGAATYLLLAVIDDAATTIFARTSMVGQTLTRALGLRGSTIDQFGVLLSAISRAVVAIVAISLLLTPFGAGNGIGSLFGRLGVLAQGIDIGGIAISPGGIVRGVAVLVVGLALVRAFMRWLETRYLPATDLDGSGRNSVSLVARYVGIALAVIWALASLGIGVERIALLLSALSVGIGFGLQAITQNFVSGLILLAERPIKIGDLVRVGTDEGDVKRISVRSTEIELADHSTLIVPNSELITKTVLNKTLANPLGRIQIQFSVPIEADADHVRAIMLAAFAGEAAVLADPPPKVFLDSIVDGRILFNCFAHVESPRAAYPARSNVYGDLLRRLRAEAIDIGTVPQKLELVAPHAAGPDAALPGREPA